MRAEVKHAFGGAVTLLVLGGQAWAIETPGVASVMAGAINRALDAERDAALEKACKAMCGGCAHDEPYQDGSHMTPGGVLAACHAVDIRLLIEDGK